MTTTTDPSPAATATYVKTTADGRVVEVIDGVVCLAGVPEAGELVHLSEHPNRLAVLQAVPQATHMAGRLPLTAAEAAVASAALLAAQRAVDTRPATIARRLQRAVFLKTRLDGVE